MGRARILIADGLPIFRSGVRNLLDRESDFDVIEAADLHEFAAVCDEAPPDLSLIDRDLPPYGAAEALRRLSECETKAIIWSFGPTCDDVLGAIRAGASGYLRKEISPRGLVRALRGVLRGEAALSRDLARLMIDALHGLDERERARQRAGALSARELEVLRLASLGERNREIAETLCISEFTVKRHMQNILHKLDLPSRRAAGAFFRAAFEADGGARLQAVGRTA
jgi:two-component system nitrate/nitrite response regulator NarL